MGILKKQQTRFDFLKQCERMEKTEMFRMRRYSKKTARNIYAMRGVNRQFISRNGSLTQSMHHSDDIKTKLITMIKQRKVLLAKSTASQS